METKFSIKRQRSIDFFNKNPKLCEQCFEPMFASRTTPPCEVKRHRFCSNRCCSEYWRARPRKTHAIKKGRTVYIKICEFCNLEFPTVYRKRKFCCCACSTKSKGKFSACASCASQIRSPKKYCNVSCAQQHKKKEIFDAWINGSKSGSGKGGELSCSIRKYLIEASGNKCSKCAWSEKNPVLGRPILTIDHIDGDWRNNTPGNLVVLCYNCHTLTPTFGTLNRRRDKTRKQGARKRFAGLVQK